MPWKSPLHQAEHAGVGVLDGAELDLVEALRAPALEVVGEALGDEADGRIELRELVGARAGARSSTARRSPQSPSSSFFFTSAALTMWISGTIDRKIADGFVSVNSTV